MTVSNTRFAIARRRFVQGLAAVAAAPAMGRPRMREIEIIEAPSNLGLRPLREGHVPGAWRAPEALRRAGLHERLAARAVHSLARPDYQVGAQPGTRILNGHAIRRYSEELAGIVAGVLAGGSAPVVVGGDCSILLGCLLGARASGRCGLVHVDGHSDFFHPGNYDTDARLGSAAGMDLALATGRGEPLLTKWDGAGTALVADADVVQIGERDELEADYAYRDIEATRIHRLPVRRVRSIGAAAAADEAIGRLRSRGLDRVWLHVDVDVLDERVMPAVDSPGRPGLDFAELEALLGRLCGAAPVIGADVSVFDPDLDPDGAHAGALARCLADGLAPLADRGPGDRRREP